MLKTLVNLLNEAFKSVNFKTDVLLFQPSFTTQNYQSFTDHNRNYQLMKEPIEVFKITTTKVVIYSKY